MEGQPSTAIREWPGETDGECAFSSTGHYNFLFSVTSQWKLQAGVTFYVLVWNSAAEHRGEQQKITPHAGRQQSLVASQEIHTRKHFLWSLASQEFCFRVFDLQMLYLSWSLPIILWFSKLRSCERLLPVCNENQKELEGFTYFVYIGNINSMFALAIQF